MLPSPRPDPLLGAVLCNTYRIDRLLGRGGMGSVYAATHLHLRTPCAVKVLLRQLSDEGVALRRFEREAQITSQLGHPNIVRVTDFNFAPDGSPFMVMELLEGETLHERLRRGALGLAEAVRLLGPLCDALGMAHERGVIHRDLKPENIFLPRDLGLDGAKILDFGVSKIRDRGTRLTRADVAMGTQSYLAPELIMGDCAEADARSDVFSMGAILFEVLTARQAYDGPNAMAVLHKLVYGDPPSARAVDEAIPGAVDAVILRALRREPAARNATAPALYQELLQAAMPYLPPAEELEAQISTPYRYTSNAARAIRQSASMPVVLAREVAPVLVAPPGSGPPVTRPMAPVAPGPMAVAPVEAAPVLAPPLPLGFPEEPAPRSPRRRGAPVTALIAALVIVTAGGLLLWRQRMLRVLAPPASAPVSGPASASASAPASAPMSASLGALAGPRPSAVEPPAGPGEPIPYSAEPPPSFAEGKGEAREGDAGRRRRHSRHRHRALPRVDLPTVDE